MSNMIRGWSRRAVLLVILVALVGATVLGLFFYRLFAQRPTPFDPDYDYPNSLTQCLNIFFATATAAPYPAQSLVPIGQPAQTDIAWFQVPQPAQAVQETAGKRARGTFVQVQLQERYLGTIEAGLSASPWKVQLVDRTGALHCVVPTPTGQLNLKRYPNDVHVGSTWTVQLMPGDPPAEFWLVFDVEPDLVKGAYLLAYDMTTKGSVSLDLGLS